MLYLIIFLTSVIATLGLAVMAARSDLQSMTIDNRFSTLIIATFFICYGALYLGSHTHIFSTLWIHLGACAVMFAVTFTLFSMGLFGGADSKLITALSLWLGFKGLPVFLISMTLIGGVLGVIALVLVRRNNDEKIGCANHWIARVKAGESKVPYGVAIAGGAIIAFIQLEYFGVATLSKFLM